MPIRLIGKKSPYTGYLMFQILNKLKNYGLGRVILRNSYKIYPETSFYIVRKVIPMRETFGPNEMVFGNVWVEETFRGRKLEGLKLLQDATYLPDFQLVPRYDEDKYLNFEPKDVLKTLPKHMELPPVLAELFKEKNPDIKGKPQIELIYNNLPEHLVYRIAEEGMTPDYKLKVELVDRLKAGIKY